MFEKYLAPFEAALFQTIANMGEKTALRDACEYALTGGGKRLRPLLVLMTADALGNRLDAMPVALSVELFHTASLIADDLPCMDDDDERRGKPSLHKKYGESIALLTSFAFIAAGYEGIYNNQLCMQANSRFRDKADLATSRCLAIAARSGGMHGVANGQFLDLFPPDKTLQTVEKIILQKTVTLFQASFVFGWLFGGGDAGLQAAVEESAFHLGVAFQIADDLQDMEQDALQGCGTNIALLLGKEAALERFTSETRLWQQGLEQLSIWNAEFEQAAQFLSRLALV